MKRFLSFLAVLILLTATTCIPGYAKVPGTPKGVEIEIIAPNQIVNPGQFIVYARITNYKAKENIKLKSAVWNLNGKEFKQIINYDLSPGGQYKEKLNKLRKKAKLTVEDEKIVKQYKDKINKATCTIAFNVTEDMAKQMKNSDYSEISLQVYGVNSKTSRAVTYSASKGVTSSTLQRLAYAPSGFDVKKFKFGDTHTHSTQSREFLGLTGTGIYTIPQLKDQAKVAGLQWIALTDHAYCLDSNTYETQKSTVTALSDSAFAYLYGEELSVVETNGDTGHMNGIMNSAFVGCVTSGILRTASSPDVQAGINSVKSSGGLVTINHPGETTSYLGFADSNYSTITGEKCIEILNGDMSIAKNTTSTNSWINKLLLTGQYVFPSAGSDTEDTNNLGKCFDAVYSDYLNQGGIKNSLEAGHHYVSTGPAIAIWARNNSGSPWSQMGDKITISGNTVDIYLSYAGANDMTIYIKKGVNGGTSEDDLITSFTTNRKNRTGYKNISVNITSGCYIRAYCVETTNAGKVAYTTPIWLTLP